MKKTITIVMMISNQYTESLLLSFLFFFFIKNGNGKIGDIDFYSIKINNVTSLFAQTMHFNVKGIKNLLCLLYC